MIQMISGVYGCRANNTIQRKTAQSGPFSLSATEEKRLVDMGVAKYVDENPQKQAEINLPQYDQMNVQQLRQLAKEQGLEGVDKKNKQELVELLQSVESDEEDLPLKPQGIE